MKKGKGKSIINKVPRKIKTNSNQVSSKPSNPSTILANLPSLVSFKNAIDQTYLKVF